MQNIPLLREALPYIQRFRNNIFVVKIGGKVVEDRDSLMTLGEDIALLHFVGIKVIVVHGGGSQATQLLQDLRHETKFVNGRRITDEQTLEVAKMVYGGKINTEILSALRNSQVQGVGISGVDANLIVAKKREPWQVLNRETGEYEEVDFGHVGDIVEVNIGVVEQLLKGGYVPVIACLGADTKGNIYNINGDTVAREIAIAIKADKFINVTSVRGILRDKNDENSLISYIDIAEAQSLLESEIVSEGMMPKVQNCIAAIKGGVRRACLIDGTDPNALLAEVFTHEGHGTMIVSVEEKARYLADEFAESETEQNIS